MSKLVNEQKSDIKPCQLLVSLSGHVNDIRDISAVSPYTHNSQALFFASCSQDTYIRTWHVTKLKDNDLSAMAGKVNVNKTNSIFDEYKSKTSYVIQLEKSIENATSTSLPYDYYNITLDSILSGHEESVSSVKWIMFNDNYALLSSSFDFTVAIWIYDSKHNIWNKEYTLGEMLGNRHAFYYATFCQDYKEVLAYSYNGAFYMWKMDDKGQYKNNLVTHGHFNGVSDICWDYSNRILFSCSEDETTRAFGCNVKNDTWHEINRPQIHGYEINTIICKRNDKDNNKRDNDLICKIISGADEKLLRVFTPSFNLIKYIKDLSGYE